MHNEIRFDSELYGEESIILNSRVKKFKVQTDVPVEIPMQVYRSKVVAQDLPIDLDEITELEDSSLFRIDEQPPRIGSKIPGTIVEISFTLNPDR